VIAPNKKPAPRPRATTPAAEPVDAPQG
jgi:translation initiation factor IF-3